MSPLQFALSFAVCVSILAVLAWLLGSVGLGPPVPDDEPELSDILDRDDP